MLEAQTELKASAAIRASPKEFGAATFAKVNVGNLAPTPEILGVIKAKTAVVCGPEAEGAADRRQRCITPNLCRCVSRAMAAATVVVVVVAIRFVRCGARKRALGSAHARGESPCR